MADERDELISDIEEITANIEKLEPQVHEEEARSGKGTQSIYRSRLLELRKDLAEKRSGSRNWRNNGRDHQCCFVQVQYEAAIFTLLQRHRAGT